MDSSDIEQAVVVLKRGGLVAFPTETVYGLGADPRNPAALRKLYTVKGRPTAHPVIVHIADITELGEWARRITPLAEKLALRFWPGPLTLILPRTVHVSDAITGGQETIGVRVPAHPLAQQLLRRFGRGVAAPSANRFGRISATAAQHVRDELGDDIDMILDAGPSEVGIESTIVDVTGSAPIIVRPGIITASEIEGCTGIALAATDQFAGRAPGTLAAHYAPSAALLVVEARALLESAERLSAHGKKVAVLARTLARPTPLNFTWIDAAADPIGYAHDLYANLRALDAARCSAILVEKLPAEPRWAAINDRIGRAASSPQP